MSRDFFPVAVEILGMPRDSLGLKTIPVIEIFGPVLQGEGAMIGKQTFFVRSGLCDYRCVWCDSMYAVLPEQVKELATNMTSMQIVERILESPRQAEWITLSGGNPAIHDFADVVRRLHDEDYKVAIETQGTVSRPWIADCDCITISPKPPSSKMVTDRDQLRRFIFSAEVNGARRQGGAINLKVVIFDEVDLTYAWTIYQEYHDRYPIYLQVGNDVGKNTAQDLIDKLGWLANRVMTSDSMPMPEAIVLPQLHVLLHGNKRGV